jgi:hypothetical protein
MIANSIFNGGGGSITPTSDPVFIPNTGSALASVEFFTTGGYLNMYVEFPPNLLMPTVEAAYLSGTQGGLIFSGEYGIDIKPHIVSSIRHYIIPLINRGDGNYISIPEEIIDNASIQFVCTGIDGIDPFDITVFQKSTRLLLLIGYSEAPATVNIDECRNIDLGLVYAPIQSISANNTRFNSMYIAGIDEVTATAINSMFAQMAPGTGTITFEQVDPYIMVQINTSVAINKGYIVTIN